MTDIKTLAVATDTAIAEELSKADFWKGTGGKVVDYEFVFEIKAWRTVITSVVIRDRIYALVQELIS